MWGLEFVSDRKTRKPFPSETNFTQRVVSHLRDNDILIAAGIPNANFGKDGDHIQISPPFTISEEEIDMLLDGLDRAIGAQATAT